LRRFPRHKKCCFVRRQPEGLEGQDQNVRAELIRLAQALGRVAGLADYVNVRLVFQKTPQTLAQQNVIVHKHATNLPA
jgi:hypothetical protein